MNSIPLRHLSIRVPWHDAAWNGTVCADPVNNASCLRLANIHERRNDELEVRLSGKRIDELKSEHHPPCVAERATFMADFPVTRSVRHPYARTSAAHKHYLPTPFRLPAYSAGAVPFRWMLRKEATDIAEELDLVFHEEAEDDVRKVMEFDSTWVQDVHNQKRLLDGFISAIEENTSLAFFYAKEVPLTEAPGRVLIGVGWVTGYGDAVEYDYEPGAERPTRSMIWERAIKHSVRLGTCSGGFPPPVSPGPQPCRRGPVV